MSCAPWAGSRRGERQHPALPHLTASRFGPRWAARSAVPTAARRSGAASDIFSSIPWGFLIAVVVTAANVDDARAAQDVFAQVRGRDFPRLRVVFADAKYHNYALYDWLSLHRRPYRLEIVSRPKGETAFKPLPVRWVVERTYSWQRRYRALSKDYEHTPESSEAMIRIAAIHHLLQRLRPKAEARSQRFRFKTHRKRVA